MKSTEIVHVGAALSVSDASHLALLAALRLSSEASFARIKDASGPNGVG